MDYNNPILLIQLDNLFYRDYWLQFGLLISIEITLYREDELQFQTPNWFSNPFLHKAMGLGINIEELMWREGS